MKTFRRAKREAYDQEPWRFGKAQTRVPSLKGLSYENAETKLHASNLNIQLLATRSDLALQPGLIIDQTPQPGEAVDYGYPIGVTITKNMGVVIK